MAATRWLRELLTHLPIDENHRPGSGLTSILNTQPNRQQEQSPSIEAPTVMAMLAQCYFKIDDSFRGLAWLSRGMREYPNALINWDGRSETFAQLRQRRLAEDPRICQRRPMVTPPLKLAYRRRFDEQVVILRPRYAPFPPNISEGSPALIFHKGRVEAMEPTTGQQLWTQAIEGEKAPLWLGVRGNLILLSSRYQVYALDRFSGELCWRVGSRPNGVESPAIDPEVFKGLAAQILGESLLVNIFEDGQAWAIEVSDGEIVWRRRLSHQYRGALAINDRYVVYTALADGRTSFVVLDSATGRTLRAFDRLDNRQVNWLDFSIDQTLIAMGSDWVSVYDPDTSKKLWSVDTEDYNRISVTHMDIGGLIYSPGDRELACLATQDGKPIWKLDASASDEEMILSSWLDGGELILAGNRAVRAFEVSSGIKRWCTRLDDDLAVDRAVLTQWAVAVIGSRPARAEKFSAGRCHVVCFIDRRDGGFLARPEGNYIDLGPWTPGRAVALYDRALCVCDRRELIGWVEARLSHKSASAPTR